MEFQVKTTPLICERASDVPPDLNPVRVRKTSFEMTGIPPPIPLTLVPEINA